MLINTHAYLHTHFTSELKKKNSEFHKKVIEIELKSIVTVIHVQYIKVVYLFLSLAGSHADLGEILNTKITFPS